jgi:anti-sigma B factor antagonist
MTVTRLDPRRAVVALPGRVDAASVPARRETLGDLAKEGLDRLVVDLSETSFLDSAGIAMLVSLLKRARATGGDVRLVEPVDEAVRRIIRLTRLDLVFAWSPSRDAALAALGAS